MSLTGHPDPTIAAWIADGPDTLSTHAVAAVKSSVRRTRQRSRSVVVPLRSTIAARRVLLVAAVLALVAAGVAALAGILPPTDVPPSSPEPTAAAKPTSRTDAHVLPDGGGGPGATIRGEPWSKRLDYHVPQGWDLDVRRQTSANVGDGSAKTGVAFTLDGVGPYGAAIGTAPPEARGVVVAEVTGATAHDPEPVGEGGARRFLERLEEVHFFITDVGDITETTFDAFPALAADVAGGHLDAVPMIDFRVPSRVIVADIDGGILLIQIWAGSDQALQAWLPDAMAFVSTFHLGPLDYPSCWSNPAAPVGLGPSGRLTLTGTPIGIDYTVPSGLRLAAESQPGVIGLAEVGPALSYGSGPAGPDRGIVIGQATRSVVHGGVEMRFGTNAESILTRLEGQPEFIVTPSLGIEGPAGLASHGARITLGEGPGEPATHIDRVGPDGRDCLIDFIRPNETSFVDADGEVVVFQAWALDDVQLEAWLPGARAFINSMRIVVGDATG